MVERTKGKWEIAEETGDGRLITTPGGTVAETYIGSNWFSLEAQQANAEFICKAANSHDKLVIIAKRYLQVLELYKESPFINPQTMSEAEIFVKDILAAAGEK